MVLSWNILQPRKQSLMRIGVNLHWITNMKMFLQGIQDAILVDAIELTVIS